MWPKASLYSRTNDWSAWSIQTLTMLFAHGLTNEDIERVMEENRVALNAELPAYSQLYKMKIYPEEFEKTPKKSIKRFLYQEAKG